MRELIYNPNTAIAVTILTGLILYGLIAWFPIKKKVEKVTDLTPRGIKSTVK